MMMMMMMMIKKKMMMMKNKKKKKMKKKIMMVYFGHVVALSIRHDRQVTLALGKDHFGWNNTINIGISHGYQQTFVYDGLGDGLMVWLLLVISVSPLLSFSLHFCRCSRHWSDCVCLCLLFLSILCSNRI
jgi:hypothetical protein